MEDSLVLWMAGSIRLWGVLAVQPLWRMVAGTNWPSIAAIIALALSFPAEIPFFIGMPTGRNFVSLTEILFIELVFGASLGLVASLPSYSLIGAVTQVDATISQNRGSSGFRMLCVMTLLSIGIVTRVHYPLLFSLHELLKLAPIGNPSAFIRVLLEQGGAQLLQTIATMGHKILLLSLTLATPILVISCVLDLVFSGNRNRETLLFAHLNIVHPWIRLTLGLIGLSASWSVYPDAWTRFQF